MWLQDKPSLVGFAKRVAGFKVSRAGGEVGVVHAGGEFLRPGQNPDVGFRNRIIRQSLEGEDVIVAENRGDDDAAVSRMRKLRIEKDARRAAVAVLERVHLRHEEHEVKGTSEAIGEGAGKIETLSERPAHEFGRDKMRRTRPIGLFLELAGTLFRAG